MIDDHDLIPADDPEADEMPENVAQQVDPVADEPAGDEGSDFALISSDEIDDALDELETYVASPQEAPDDEELDRDRETPETEHDEHHPPDLPDTSGADSLETIDEDERLRGPRAEVFRRRRRNRIAFLPLALYLIGIGIFLIASEQDIANLPVLSALEVSVLSMLAGAFTMIFHATLFNRYERGLLFTGLWLSVTIGMIAGLVYFVDDKPDAVEWWPLLIGSSGVTLIINYFIEPNHDARLVWLAVLCMLTTSIALSFTIGGIDEASFSTLADYWPLLVSVIGIGLVPLVFRRQME